MKRTMRWSLLLLLFLPGLTLLAADDVRVDGAYMNAVTLNRVTPHLEFAKPAAGGPLHALFIIPNALAAREVAELAQRLELDFDLVSTLNENELGAGQGNPYAAAVQGLRQAEKEAELLAKLRTPHAAIVLGCFKFSQLPEATVTEILRQVRSGTGLVLVQRQADLPEKLRTELAAHPEPADRDYLWQNTPYGGVRYFQNRWKMPPAPEQLGTFRLGTGRVAVLDYQWPVDFTTNYGGPGLTPPAGFDYDLPVKYEILLSLPAKAMRWCAGQVPLSRIESMTSEKHDNGTSAIRIKVKTAAAGRFSVKLKVCDSYNRWFWEKELDLAGTETVFALPELCRTEFLVRAWLRDGDGRTLDWADLMLVGGRSDGKPVLELLDLGQRRLQPGAELKAKVKLLRPLQTGESAAMQLRDTADQIVLTLPLTVTDNEALATGKLPLQVPPVLRPVFVLEENGRLTESLENLAWSYLVDNTDAKRFHGILWGQNDPGLLGRMAYETYAGCGFDTVLGPLISANLPLLQSLNLQQVMMSYPLNVHNSADAKQYQTRFEMRSFPFEAWLQPEDQAKYLQEWTRLAGIARDQRCRVLTFSLGDEISLGGRDIGFSAWWLPPFRVWLREQYRNDLAALNRNWATAYQSFDEATPQRHYAVASRTQYREKVEQANDKSWQPPADAAPEPVTYAPYLDHRSFVQEQFAAMLSHLRDAVQAGYPGSRIGFEGAGAIEPYYGISLPAVARTAGMLAPYYNRTTNELIRCFRQPDLLWGNWFGGYVSERKIPGRTEFLLWDMLFSGANSLWYFAAIQTECGLNLDLSPAPHLPVASLTALKNGLGEWLATARIEEDPVAILYSEPSNQVLAFEYPWGYYLSVQEAWLAAFTDLGITPRYLDHAGLTAGQLTPDRYKVLVLPNAVALAPDEVAAIRRFAEKGGTVIADLRPGVLNEHGLYLANGQLDDLFGITRTTTRRQTKLQPVHLILSKSKTALELTMADTDPTVKPAAGKAVAQLADGTPLLVVNRCGKGRALLLNFNLTAYNRGVNDSRSAKWPQPLQAHGVGEWLRQTLTQAGVTPEFRVTDVNGKPLRGVRLTRFEQNGQRLLGVLPETGGNVVVDALGQSRTNGNSTRPTDLPAHLDLGRKYWIREVLAGTDHGRVKKLPVSLAPGQAQLFILSPHQEKSVRLNVPE